MKLIQSVQAGLLALIIGFAAQPLQSVAQAQGIPSAEARAQHGQYRPRDPQWVRSELYFGLGDAQASEQDKQREQAIWRDFLDAEVTPRFPDGLTVLDAYGQWMPSGGSVPERLDSKVLLILHENKPRERAQIEAIRNAWKRIHGDESVLWSMQPAWVSF